MPIGEPKWFFYGLIFIGVDMTDEELYRQMLKHKDDLSADLGFARREFMVNQLGLPNRQPSVFNIPSYDDTGGPWGNNPLPEFIKFYYQQDTGYRTGTGNYLELTVSGYAMPKEYIPLMTVQESVAACGPCKGSSGGCPGFSPRFNWLTGNCNDIFLITVSFDMAWTWKYNKSNRFDVINKLSYADRLTENYTRRLVTHMNAANAGMYLGLGNCFGCRPKLCTVIKGLTCTKWDKRSFSCEATGVDCDALHIMLYGEPLPWYYKGTNQLQTYMTRYSLFFVRKDINYSNLLHDAVISDKSYEEPGQEAPPQLSVSSIKVPRGVHMGSDLWVYGALITS